MDSLQYGRAAPRQINPRVYAACMQAWPKLGSRTILMGSVAMSALMAGLS